MSAKSTISDVVHWQWPSVGAAASHEGLDSEIFDTEKFPHAHTFVRETIQNILDAKKPGKQTVTARFEFFEDTLGSRGGHLADLIAKRKHCNLPWPSEWDSNLVRWLVIEDENTTGLLGDLEQRKSDFWGYWLNFGRSNKSGEGRGGRGIGRVTFLLASEIHTVLGVTRRQHELDTICCGMSVLKADEWEGKFRGSFAFYADGENENILKLHQATNAQQVAQAFATDSYDKDDSSGLSLVIPYPRKELDEKTICAAAIENFAPAIAAGILNVVVGEKTIDSTSLGSIAVEVRGKFTNSSFQQDPKGIISIVSSTKDDPDFEIEIGEEQFTGNLKETLENEILENITEKFEENEFVSFLLKIPVSRNNTTKYGELYICMRRTPVGNTPTDMFYRGGMYLPHVQAVNKADIDVFLFCRDDALSVYLNFCEGKAHLGLLENTEVLEKLREKGYEGRISLKRFVNTLPRKARSLVQSDNNEPDASVFAKWFAAPGAPKASKKKRKKKIVIVPPPKPKVSYFSVKELANGFEIKANPTAGGWPLNLNVRFAYADGRATPKWSKFDFRIKDLQKTVSGCEHTKVIETEKDSKAGLYFQGCDQSFSAKIIGFDANRELIVHHTPLRPKVSTND
ncbi:hypothetical protein LZG00_15645 [Rhodobacteraceae bacterium LMO-12]|nr:hypothetical protein [Rhodobacteraceae bacterium LMO-JJ12]